MNKPSPAVLLLALALAGLAGALANDTTYVAPPRPPPGQGDLCTEGLFGASGPYHWYVPAPPPSGGGDDDCRSSPDGCGTPPSSASTYPPSTYPGAPAYPPSYPPPSPPPPSPPPSPPPAPPMPGLVQKCLGDDTCKACLDGSMRGNMCLDQYQNRCMTCAAIANPQLRKQCYDCLMTGVPADKSQCDRCQAHRFSEPAQSLCFTCMVLGSPGADKSYCTDCLDSYKSKDDKVTDLLNLQQKCMQCVEVGVPNPANRYRCLRCPYQRLYFKPRNAWVEVSEESTIGCLTCLQLGNPSESDPLGKERCRLCIPSYIDRNTTAERTAFANGCYNCLQSGVPENGPAKDSCLHCPQEELTAGLQCFDSLNSRRKDSRRLTQEQQARGAARRLF